MPIDLRRTAAVIGIGAAALVLGLAAHDITRGWQEARQERAVADNAERTFHSPTSFVAGNPGGDVGVAAFFDYNCPYCRKDAPALAKLIAGDKEVRLVLKELPVLGPDSEAVARVALAAGRQGQYFELYERLFAERGRATEAKAMAVAGELGLDQERLKEDMQDPAIAAALAENARLAKDLKVRGVPFYVVGDRVLREASGDFYADLTRMVAEARASGQKAASGP